MIARQQVQSQPRIRNVRTARGATQQRRKKSAQIRNLYLGRFIMGLGAVVVLLVGYVMMTANLASLNYSIQRAQTQRLALQDMIVRDEDRIATLRSQERLAGIAGKLGMHEAQQNYAIVQLPQVT